LYITYKIGSPYIVIPSEIKELNKNINLPFNFGEEVSEEELKENGWSYKRTEYYITSYMNEYDDVLLLNGFPDLADSDKFATYTIRSEQIRVFDIGINDNIEDARKILKKFGYNEDFHGDAYCYTKGKVKIWVDFSTVEKTIGAIQIQLLSTDWFHNGNYK